MDLYEAPSAFGEYYHRHLIADLMPRAQVKQAPGQRGFAPRAQNALPWRKRRRFSKTPLTFVRII